MTRTGPADVVMPACGRTASGARPRPALARPCSRALVCAWPASREPSYARAVFPGVASFKPASGRLAGRSRRLGPACLPPGRRCVTEWHLPHSLCPQSPALAHPLYLYLHKWHAAALDGCSFDPGRDMLCILFSPPRPQWP